jgi:hypothetical protein
MKRLLSITLALSLLGSSAAFAHDSYRGGDYRHSYERSAPYHGGYGYGYRHDNGANTAAAVGVGILALGLFAALASQHNDDYYNNRYYAPPPPPPPSYGYGYGYNPGYGR